MSQASSPLTRLFQRQQPKVRFSPRKRALLKTCSEDNLAAIALLIKKWLEEDEKLAITKAKTTKT